MDSRECHGLGADESVVILVVDSQTSVIVDANPAAVRFYGYGDLIGMPLGRIVRDLGATLQGAQVHRLASGEVRQVSVGIRALADGTVELVVTDASDHGDAALPARTRMLHAVLDASADSTMCLNRDMRVEYVNARLIDVSGIPLKQWIGKTHREMGYPQELVRIWEGHNREVFESGREVTYEFDIVNDGHHQWFETTVAPVLDDHGSVAWVVATSHEITQRRMIEQELRTSRKLLERAQRIAHVGTWTLDTATNTITWTRELSVMMGLDPLSPAPGLQDLESVFTAQSWQDLTAAISLAQEQGVPYELELQTLHPDGASRWMLARGEAMFDDHGRVIGVQGVAMDITERKLAMDQLQVMATHDGLTGLPNRNALLAEVARALASDRRSGLTTAVLMLDLDRFKDVNDVLGHSSGDELLMTVSDRLGSAVRATDLVARLGGDEFVVVMCGLRQSEEAVRAAERLVQEFRRPFPLANGEVFVTASVGVVIATAGDDAGDLMRDADTAMYTAKAAGRDRVSVYNEEQRTVVAARLALETDLRRALARGEFAMWYQPEIDLATGEVIAFEALLRWHHPDGEVRTAQGFIDVLEGTGLILEIGAWALHEACAQAALWTAARPARPVTIRVNVSVLQLAERGLLKAIDHALEDSGLVPAQLCLEITETALLAHTAVASENLTGIHERGICLAIDDFGTGYASLTYLRRYPISVIKMDRSFLPAPGGAQHDHRLVLGIITLAGILGLTVTAEGVEDATQAAHLRELGCPSAAGWFYSQALPADQIPDLLNRVFPHG